MPPAKKRSEIPEHAVILTILSYWKVLIPVVLFAILFYVFILRDLPSPTKLSTTNFPQSTQIFDRNGVLLYTIYGSRNQTFIPLSQIPVKVQDATIAIEDKDFYHHGPIDLRGMARAAYETIFHKQLQGGSTITQQLVKNTLLSPEQTLTRKMREIVLSFVTEILYPKGKILELYLNQIPYGGTAYGIQAAAQTYFKKDAKDLDLAQAALLAGLPEAPTAYSPYGPHPELAKERQLQVLKAMTDNGYITEQQREQAAEEPLNYADGGDIKAPHFVFYVKDLLEKKYGAKMVEEGGLRVTTSLDSSLQNFAQATVATEVANLTPYHVTNGAVVVSNPATGEILAMVGSRDYFDTTDTDGNVNIALQLRQPGSSIKPVNYADGIIHGYFPATPFIDQPTCFPNPAGQAPYCPVNYDGKFHGIVDMRTALGNSFNIPAVKMLKVNGVQNMLDLAKQMGITTWGSADQYGLSLTLGGGEVTMLDMTTAYGVFANGGYRVDLHPILKVTDSKGNVLEQYTPLQSPIFGEKVLPDGVAYIISDILADNNARLMEFGPSSELHIPGKFVSVKTGTTNDFRDNWTIGYTSNYVVTTWVGNNDNSPMSSIASGITGAAPIWNKVMTYLLADKPAPTPPRPDTVIQMPVCNISGTLPTPQNQCPTHMEYFLKGVKYQQASMVTENEWIDKSTNRPPAPGKTDDLELRPETVLTDPTGDKYCLTCPPPTEAPTPTP